MPYINPRNIGTETSWKYRDDRSLHLLLILVLLSLFFAEVEVALPRPYWAQKVAGIDSCRGSLLSIMQELVAESFFLVAMVAGSLVEAGARLTLHSPVSTMVDLVMLGGFLRHSCGWWQRLQDGGTSG
ncbi:hypothetical protein L7F22_006280 [Adiantum nelumboides]|nr:hypothetical protein [Adiantum nelumboides]